MVFLFLMVLTATLHNNPKLNNARVLLYLYANYNATSIFFAAIDLMVPRWTALFTVYIPQTDFFKIL